MPTPLARRLADDLWILDTRYLDEPGIIASYLLTGRHGAALIDVGSGATLNTLLRAIQEAGVDPGAIGHLVLTHIHLDHAGAAGALLRSCPRARVYVHPRGAPHLVDPSKLLASAARIYGADMDRLWGTMEPVPRDRLTVLADGDELRVGERAFHAVYTPGHAVHHIAYHDGEHAALFAGDVAGVRLEDVPVVRPPTPPPDLQLEDWYASIARIEALRPDTLYLPHYGKVTEVTRHLASLRARLAEWGDVVLDGMRRHLAEDDLVMSLGRTAHADLASSGTVADDKVYRRYELAANFRMSAQGYVRYYTKYHPELLA